MPIGFHTERIVCFDSMNLIGSFGHFRCNFPEAALGIIGSANLIIIPTKFEQIDVTNPLTVNVPEFFYLSVCFDLLGVREKFGDIGKLTLTAEYSQPSRDLLKAATTLERAQARKR